MEVGTIAIVMGVMIVVVEAKVGVGSRSCRMLSAWHVRYFREGLRRS